MFLVDVERDRKPYTLNHYFSSHLQQSRSLRVTENFRSLAEDKDTDVGKRNVIELDRIQSAVNDKTYTEHVKEDIHDILEAYYKIARERFVDNIYQQAVDHCLLSGPGSPLRLFSEHWVLQLDNNKLAAIAGESRSIRDRREKLKKKVHDLEVAMDILL